MLLGRDHELASCRTALLAEHHPAAAVIAGEPGIGKTTLFRSLLAEAQTSGSRVLVTTGLPSDVDLPLGNLVDLLDPAARDVLGELPAPQAQALRVVLKLAPAGGLLDDVLILRATVNALRALHSGGRLMVAVDDAQWLDPDTQRVLSMAVTGLSQAAVGWLVSFRTGDEDPRLAQAVMHELPSSTARLVLGQLDSPAVSELVMQGFPGQWSPGLLHRIVRLAQGNPYTALELARETLAAGGYDAPTARVPRSLTGILNARLRRLDPSTLAVVQAAAVTPRPTRRLLRAVVEPQADEAVDDAIDAGVLCRSAQGPLLNFSHPLLHEVAASTMSWSQRRSLHRALAEAVEDPDEAARHLAAYADEPDESIATKLEEAAARISRGGSPLATIAVAEAALRLTPDPDGVRGWARRLALLRYLEKAEEYRRARTLIEDWATATPPREARGWFTFFCGMLTTDGETRVRMLAQAVDEMDDDPADAAFVGARLADLLASEHWRFEEARNHAVRAVRNARRADAPEVLRWALSTLADIDARMGDPGAEDLLRAAVAMPGWEDMWVPMHSPEGSLAGWHMRRGELDPARELVQKLFEASEREAREAGMGHARWCFIVLDWAEGRWNEAEQHMRLYEPRALLKPVTWTAVATVRYLLRAGRGPASHARAGLAEAVTMAESLDDLPATIMLRGIGGQLELSADDPAAAIAWLDPVADVLRGRALAEVLLNTFEGDLIESYVRTGRSAEAAERLQALHEAADRAGNPWAQITYRRAKAVLDLSHGDAAAAVQDLGPALSTARGLRLTFELGRCLLILGTAQRRSRQRREAAHTLTHAVDTFDGLAATSWSQQARTELARLNHAAQNVLTPTEQRITELVGQGSTNAEIAAALLVKEKTVEANLTRIYRKLGIRNRSDLTRKVASGI
jgi:DNA-binding CsgD family transcriptional regulator